MARMSVPRWSVYVVVAALFASLSFSFGSLYSAFGTSHGTTYYACLYAGSLSQVSTTPPVNCGRGQQINWNSEGILGPQGPAGATNVILRTAFVNVPANSSGNGSVDCLEGEKATGGGFRSALDTTKASQSRPAFDQNIVPNGWFVRFQNSSGTLADQAEVYVICASP